MLAFSLGKTYFFEVGGGILHFRTSISLIQNFSQSVSCSHVEISILNSLILAIPISAGHKASFVEYKWNTTNPSVTSSKSPNLPG